MLATQRHKEKGGEGKGVRYQEEKKQKSSQLIHKLSDMLQIERHNIDKLRRTVKNCSKG